MVNELLLKVASARVAAAVKLAGSDLPISPSEASKAVTLVNRDNTIALGQYLKERAPGTYYLNPFNAGHALWANSASIARNGLLKHFGIPLGLTGEKRDAITRHSRRHQLAESGILTDYATGDDRGSPAADAVMSKLDQLKKRMKQRPFEPLDYAATQVK